MKQVPSAAAALILAALPCVPAAATPVDDAATTTPIKHVVWMMQDNHSFDNYFGTYPGADGIPGGVCQRLNLTGHRLGDASAVSHRRHARRGSEPRASASRSASTTVAGWMASSPPTDGSGLTAPRRWGTTTAATSRSTGTWPISTCCSTGSSPRRASVAGRLPLLASGQRARWTDATDEQRGLRRLADDLRQTVRSQDSGPVLRREPRRSRHQRRFCES